MKQSNQAKDPECLNNYTDVNEVLHKWFMLACSRNIFLIVHNYGEKAEQIAEQLGHSCTSTVDDEATGDAEPHISKLQMDG